LHKISQKRNQKLIVFDFILGKDEVGELLGKRTFGAVYLAKVKGMEV
jgi:hypothetical protein